MDIRTISSATYSRQVAPVAGGDVSLPVEDVKSTNTAAPFLSPVYRFDPVAKLSILSFRDSGSGDVIQQIPSEKVVEQYRRTRGESPDAKPAASTANTTATPVAKADLAKAPGDGATEAAPRTDSVPDRTVPVPAATPVAAASELTSPAPAASDVQRVSLSV